jgi:hypothetical protein
MDRDSLLPLLPGQELSERAILTPRTFALAIALSYLDH